MCLLHWEAESVPSAPALRTCTSGDSVNWTGVRGQGRRPAHRHHVVLVAARVASGEQSPGAGHPATAAPCFSDGPHQVGFAPMKAC